MKTTIHFKVVAGFLTLLAAAASAQTVSNDGSFGYSYPFALPAARGKYQPSLALSYSSNGGTTNYGTGWSLTANYIEATTRATRTTTGSARTRYTLVMDGGSRLLALGTDGQYHPDVSQSWFRVSQNDPTTGSATTGPAIPIRISARTV